MQAFVAAFHAKHKKLHILINNGALAFAVAEERGGCRSRFFSPCCGAAMSRFAC